MRAPRKGTGPERLDTPSYCRPLASRPFNFSTSRRDEDDDPRPRGRKILPSPPRASKQRRRRPDWHGTGITCVKRCVRSPAGEPIRSAYVRTLPKGTFALIELNGRRRRRRRGLPVFEQAGLDWTTGREADRQAHGTGERWAKRFVYYYHHHLPALIAPARIRQVFPSPGLYRLMVPWWYITSWRGLFAPTGTARWDWDLSMRDEKRLHVRSDVCRVTAEVICSSNSLSRCCYACHEN